MVQNGQQLDQTSGRIVIGLVDVEVDPATESLGEIKQRTQLTTHL